MSRPSLQAPIVLPNPLQAKLLILDLDLDRPSILTTEHVDTRPTARNYLLQLFPLPPPQPLRLGAAIQKQQQQERHQETSSPTAMTAGLALALNTIPEKVLTTTTLTITARSLTRRQKVAVLAFRARRVEMFLRVVIFENRSCAQRIRPLPVVLLV